MQQTQQGNYSEYDHLPCINTLDQNLILQLDQLMSGNWIDSFQGITALRSINKYYPQHTPDAIARYMNILLELINHGKTQIVKNSFALISQVFQIGKRINVETCVLNFVGVMIKKSANQLGKVKQMANGVLNSFVNNCGYDISFVIVCEFCDDKNATISQISVKLLAKLIQNIGVQITLLKPETLQKIMKTLVFLLNGKRQNLKNWGKQVCMFIYKTIGNQNYLNLMNYVLSRQEMESMMIEMQGKKTSKSKQIIPLANLLKQRKNMMKMNNNNDGFGNGNLCVNRNELNNNNQNRWG